MIAVIVAVVLVLSITVAIVDTAEGQCQWKDVSTFEFSTMHIFHITMYLNQSLFTFPAAVAVTSGGVDDPS